MVLGTRVSSYLKEYLMSKKEIEIKGKFRKEDFFFPLYFQYLYSTLVSKIRRI